jgi:hypothetical protein
MATADAFDEPMARPMRPAKVITDAVESGPTILRDPNRRNGSLTAGDAPSTNGSNGADASHGYANGLGTNGSGGSGLGDTALVETVAPPTMTPPPDGWPVPPPVEPFDEPTGFVESPATLAPAVAPVAPPPLVAPSAPSTDDVVDGPQDWADDGADEGAQGDIEEDAIEVPVRRSRRPRVRKVNRVVRRIDPWTVFKIALVLFVLLYAVLVVAGVLLWDLANKTGTVDNIQGAVKELFALQTFVIDGKKLFRASWALGAIMAIGGTGFAVTAAVLFNLIADLVGGVRITVLEEEYVARESRSSRRAARG